ncbi:MAG: HAMP domain-containing protein [Gemmatimonadota bacterium]
MDLRTKLIFAFVATSLASMLVLGAFSYGESAASLRRASAQQLESLAAARARDLSTIAEALREQVRLIQSRTNLRVQVAAYDRDPEGARPVIQRIIDDAEQSAEIVTRITVYDTRGEVIARSGTEHVAYRLLGTLDRGEGTVTRYYERPDRTLATVMEAPLSLDGRVVGRVASELAVGSFVDLTGSYVGLGETGEILLPMELTPGFVTFLNPLRHRESDTLAVLPLEEVSRPVRMALNGEEGVVQDVPDYRGVDVWAAVRTVADPPVGLVVKVDAAEELAPVAELRRRLVRVGLSVAALAILAGSLVGTLMARRLRRLNEVVRMVRDGQDGLRASEAGEDEVSFLAESFNRLMDHMQDRAPR